VLGVDGVADSNAQHSRRHDDEVNSMASTSWRSTAMTCGGCRCRCGKTDLARLLARRPDGIFVAPFEAGEIGLARGVRHGTGGAGVKATVSHQPVRLIRLATSPRPAFAAGA
jgi:hypothetical protein